MSKDYERVRIKVKKEFEARLLELDRLKKVEVEYNQLKVENDTLRQENEQLKDWVERLLEYCNLSEEDMKLLRDDLSTTKSLKSLVDIASSFKSIFGTF